MHLGSLIYDSQIEGQAGHVVAQAPCQGAADHGRPLQHLLYRLLLALPLLLGQRLDLAPQGAPLRVVLPLQTGVSRGKSGMEGNGQGMHGCHTYLLSVAAQACWNSKALTVPQR